MLEESVSLWASMYSWFTPTVLFVFLNLMIGTIAITSSFSKSNRQDHSHHHRTHNQIQDSPSVLQRLKSINLYSYRSPEPASGFEKSPDFLNPNLRFDDDHRPLENHPPPASIEQNQPFLPGSPSVLQKIKSFNLYNYISQDENSPYTGGEPATKGKLQESDLTVGTVHKFKGAVSDEKVISPTLDEIYSNLKGSEGNHVSKTKSDSEPAAGKFPKKLQKKMRKSASTKSPFGHFEEEDIITVEARRPATVKEGKASKLEGVEDADEEVDAKADDFINRFKQQLKLQRIDSVTRYTRKS